MTIATSLEELCTLVVDCPHSTPKWTDTGVVVLRSNNIRGGRLNLAERSYTDETHYQQRSRRAEIQAGDLVITREAPMGEVCIIPVGLRCCLGQRMVLLRPDAERCDGRFLLYALQSAPVQEQISWSEGTGSTVSNLRIPHLKALRIPTPPLAKQRAIAGVLGALDDKIEQNRRTARALERLARAIFRAWFVDFEPVKAKAAGAASFPSMPQAAFDALPTRLVDSAIGPVPEGWEVKAMSEVAEATKGLSYKGAGLVKDPAQFATAKPLHNLNSIYEGGGYKNHGVKYYSGDFKPRHVLKPGDLIVANTEQGFEYRLIGFPAIVPARFGPDGLFTHHTFKLHPRDDAGIGRHFLYHALLGGRVREEVCGCTNGTTVNMLSVDGLQRPLLCVPQAGIAESFEEAAGAIYQQSELLHDESAKLAELRDLLLPKLLSGEVRVGGAVTQAQTA